MRALPAVASVAAIALFIAPGCKKSKADKCGAAWDEAVQLIEAMSKELGGGKGDKPTAEDKKEFMDKCMALPDNAVDCMSFSKMGDPKCEEIMEKAEAEAEAKAPPMKLEWEDKTVADGRVSIKAPKGWKQEDFMGAQFSPTEDELSFWNNLTVNAACGGMCDAMPAADWAKRFEENEVANLKDSGSMGAEDLKIEKDEPIGTNGRFIQASSKLGNRKTTTIIVGMWQDNDDHYYTCKAELSKGLTKNLAEFEKACREMKILHKPEAPAPTEAPAPADAPAPAPAE
jgi:hypothetical protein